MRLGGTSRSVEEIDMGKIMMIHPEKCVGCKNCELACSFQHEGDFRPGAACVHTVQWDKEGFSAPMMCRQCDDAACVNVCPTGAMHHSTNGRKLVVFDKDACIGCKLCVIACPFGCVHYDTVTESISKCDLCGACAQFCPNGALELVDDAEQTRSRQEEVAEKLKNALEEAS
jgi:carbon-monoxide dehydrogenase iron sulfur subunit